MMSKNKKTLLLIVRVFWHCTVCLKAEEMLAFLLSIYICYPLIDSVYISLSIDAECSLTQCKV